MSGSKQHPANKSLIKKVPEKTFPEKNVIWAVGIAIIIFVVFSPALTADFINFDDIQYVTDNPYIRNITIQNLKTILLTDLNGTGNYHPLTFLSFAADYFISGSKPWGYHLTNIIFHLFNTILVYYLVFIICTRIKKKNKVLISIITALFFGIHPMHVESVAWVSGRKDLLYTFFYLFSILCYLQYLDRSKGKFYIISIIFFLFSLLSKAMAVTLPVILLLIDYLLNRKLRDKKILTEKIPYFFFSFLFGMIAVLTQKSGGATEIIKNNFLDQMVFASYGFTQYVIRIIYPFHLSPYYPYPERTNGTISWPYYLCFITIIITCLLLAYLTGRKKDKKVTFGLLFFIINLALVLQIVPVGSAVMADRYTYLSSIGLFFILGIGVALLVEKFPKQKIFYLVILVSYITVLSVKAHDRCFTWKNSTSFWEDVNAKFPRFAPALNNLGIINETKGNKGEAITFYTKAMEADPEFANAVFNRGTLYGKTGQFSKAIPDLDKAIKLAPGFVKAYTNRAIAKAQSDDLTGALNDLNQAISLEKSEDAYYNRGFLKIQLKDYRDAINDLTEAIKLNSGSVKSYFSRGLANLNMRNFKEANADFTICINSTPGDGNAYYYRAISKINSGEARDCCEDLQKALQLGNKQSEVLLRQYCNK